MSARRTRATPSLGVNVDRIFFLRKLENRLGYGDRKFRVVSLNGSNLTSIHEYSRFAALEPARRAPLRPRNHSHGLCLLEWGRYPGLGR